MSAGGLKNPPPQGQAKEKSEKPLPNEKVQQVDEAASNTTNYQQHHLNHSYMGLVQDIYWVKSNQDAALADPTTKE